MSTYRIEKDSMGEMRVPGDAYYGAQTQRAVENFPISGIRFPRRFLWALGLVKKAAAETNAELGLLDRRRAEAIRAAAEEVMMGKLDAHFPLDVFQTGSGTSTNMNANEVIAARACELLGGKRSSREVHPNDHVNLCQSSNDVIPTVLHVAVAMALHDELLPALTGLERALGEKARAFEEIIKIGRTHLQDATPVRLGQVFGGYASQVAHGRRRVRAAVEELLEVPLGGTAVGTGLNCHPEFPGRTIARLAGATGLPFREAVDHFEAQGARDAAVFASGALKVVATSLFKIANDLRWLACGPRAGFAEIVLPAVQPGSSIMPGKVNPVLNEALLMVSAQVIGNDLAVTLGGMNGNFELNAMIPLIAHNLLQSGTLLAQAVRVFTERCVAGISADAARCRGTIEGSLAMCTALVPRLGHDAAAALAKEALTTGRTVREVARARGVLPEAELDEVLDPRTMTERGFPGGLVRPAEG
jgi:fumarate hydratase class II